MDHPQISTCFWFDMNGLEAAQLYTSVVPDSQITHVTEPTSNTPGRADGVPLEVYFRLGTQHFVALNGGPQFPHSSAASIQLYVDGQDELDRIWSALLADGGPRGGSGASGAAGASDASRPSDPSEAATPKRRREP